MRDVAALAGVSITTVSRVVNAEPHTRPEVVARVRAAIAELDWVPNGSARVLRTGRTGVVGIGVAPLRRPYCAVLVEALVAEASTRADEFDGVLHVGPLPGDVELVGALGSAPLVVVQGGHRDDADSVDEDIEQALVLVARHLTLMGRRRPVLLGPDRGRRRCGLLGAAVARPARGSRPPCGSRRGGAGAAPLASHRRLDLQHRRGRSSTA